MRTFFKLLIVFILPGSAIHAQYSLYKGNNSLELSGYIASYYNYRFYQGGETDKNKNRFALDYGVLRVSAMSNKKWFYELQLNIPAISDPSSSDGFIMQASASYKPLKDNWEFEFGYDKVPFSRSSLIPNTDAPFLQRAEVARGVAFNRRDVGFTISNSLLNKRLTFWAGAYTGLGSQTLAGTNDASGKLEYAARAEYAFTARYRHREIDLVHVPVPLVSIGINGRYAEKNSATGVDFPILTINGKKTTFGADISAAFKGLSAAPRSYSDENGAAR